MKKNQKKHKNHLKQRPLSTEWSLSAQWSRSRPLLRPLKRLLCWLLKKGRGLVSGRPMKVQEKACWQCIHCALFRGLAEGLHWGIVLHRPPLPLLIPPPGCCLRPVLHLRVCSCSFGLLLCIRPALDSEDQPGVILLFSSSFLCLWCFYCFCSFLQGRLIILVLRHPLELILILIIICK